MWFWFDGFNTVSKGIIQKFLLLVTHAQPILQNHLQKSQVMPQQCWIYKQTRCFCYWKQTFLGKPLRYSDKTHQTVWDQFLIVLQFLKCTNQGDNFRHIALSVKRFLVKYQIPILEHPTYSPDLAPCDFLWFPRSSLQRKEQDLKLLKR